MNTLEPVGVMLNRNARLVLLIASLALPACLAQKQSARSPAYIEDPSSILHLWNCLGAHKNVTHEYPTDYQYGKVYRLKTDVVVWIGGTSSRVTEYWVRSGQDVEAVEKWIEEARKTGRKSDQEILRAGTRFRFGQIWLEGNFETGIYVMPYAECLDAPLRGKQVEIGFISNRDAGDGKDQCKVDPKYLELVAE